MFKWICEINILLKDFFKHAENKFETFFFLDSKFEILCFKFSYA